VIATRRGGRLMTPLLLIVGCLLTALALLAGWAQWQLMSDDAWGDTSQRLLEQKEIRDRLAQYLVDEVQRSSGGSLAPDAARRLRRGVSRELATQRAKRVWRVSTTEAHHDLVRLIKDDSASRGDVVTLDLRPLIRSVGRELGVPLPVLPASVGHIEVVAGDEVRGARNAADTLHQVAAALLIAAPVVLLLALLAARGWRSQALAGVGVAVAVAGALVLLTRALVGAHVVDVLTSHSSDRDAVAAAWSAGTWQLAWMAGAAIMIGLLLAVGASIAGRAAPRPRYL
jgi:hypothetical protein